VYREISATSAGQTRCFQAQIQDLTAVLLLLLLLLLS